VSGKTFYISVVSHGHDDLIMSNIDLVSLLGTNCVVVVKDNLKSDNLMKYCSSVGFHYITTNEKCGFGENNNIVFKYCQDLGMSNDDYFVTLNPDVIIDSSNFQRMQGQIEKSAFSISAPKLFSDKSHTVIERSVRQFPNVFSILRPFLGKPVNKPYDLYLLNSDIKCDWASGAFLVFSSSIYGKLLGFDNSYFMYFEDVDICYRAQKEYGYRVNYLSAVHATHFGGYQNRNVFSQHFFWYLKSLINFLRKTL
jgi:N-acetylglucosaminyl-diphospho-decaprenol L-rhamnosyltransferase